jgi:hypothetical protein
MMTTPPKRDNQRARRGSVGRDASGRWFYVYDVEAVDGRRRQIRRRGFSTRAAARLAMSTAQNDNGRPGSTRNTGQ